MRPYTLDYIPRIFTEFDELLVIAHLLTSKAIVGGPAMLDDQPVMIIGQGKGRTPTKKLSVTSVCLNQKATVNASYEDG